MDEYQLQGLINLLEQFRHDYDPDGAIQHVHIAYLLKRIEDIKERLSDATDKEAI